jgi:VWFA-related protein
MGQQTKQPKRLSLQPQSFFSAISVRSVVHLYLALLVFSGWLGRAPVRIAAAQGKEQTPAPQAETAAAGVVKSESNVVLVDVIVTDKKGRYLRDIKQKEFHVFEDGAEQPITSFSREADIHPVAPDRQRYMVLFFDNEGLGLVGQMGERDAAAKFVEGTAHPQAAQGPLPLQHPIMAVLNYDGGLHVAQNFTTDSDVLISAIRNTNAPPPQTITPAAPWQANDIGSNSPPGYLLAALRNVAGTLATVPGRKTVLFFSAVSSLTSRSPWDYQNTIDALNKANVCIYTLSAGGLEGGGVEAETGRVYPFRVPDSSTVQQQSMRTLGSMGGTTSKPEDLSKLALQTGGLSFVNTNDLASGIEKVSGEMDEYYLLGYIPPSSTHDGRYHKIQVTVDRAGVEVRARNGYADPKSPDLLAGKTEGVALEAKATNFEAGRIPVALRTPYFYVRPGVARVDLALSIPGSAIEFEKQRDDFRSQVNVVGIAYRDDGSVAARFSDKVHLDYARDEQEGAEIVPFNYQTSFRIAAGDYTFKLVVSAGGAEFGKYVTPLVVDPFSGKQLTLSGPAFGDKAIPSLLSSSDIDQKNVEGSVPMVAGGAQLVPSSSDHFKQGAQPVVYVEVYDPLLEGSNPQMGILFNILNAKNDQKVYSSNTLPISRFARQGNPLVPVIFKLPTDKLPAGDYRLEIWARDSAQNISPMQTGNFSIE